MGAASEQVALRSRPPALPRAEQEAKNLLFLPSITAAPRRPGAELGSGCTAPPGTQTAIPCHQSLPRQAAFEQKVKRFTRCNFLMFGGICQDTCKFCIRPGHHLPADELRCPRAPARLGSSPRHFERSVERLQRQEGCFRRAPAEKPRRDTKIVLGQRPSAEV